MGITDFSITLLNKVIEEYRPKSVCEMGDQNLYTGDNNYGKYANLYYEQKGIEEYACIDINGGNNAFDFDMSYPIDDNFAKYEPYDLVTDFGFSEHVGRDGKFDWEAIYNCWQNKHNLLKIGGIMVNENPLEKNWPLHGFNFYGWDFYTELAELSGYEILEQGIHPAMGNITDGYNLYSILKKNSVKFPSLSEFKTLPLKQS